MKNLKITLTKTGTILLMSVSITLYNQTVKGQIYCNPNNITLPVATSPLGNVGIKSNNPRSSLHIGLLSSATLSPITYISPHTNNSTPDPTNPDPYLEGLSIQSYTNNTDGYRRYSDITALGYGDGGSGGSALRFLTNNSDNGIAIERMRIDRNGRIGIGTSNPSAALQINSNYQEALTLRYIMPCLYATHPSIDVFKIEKGYQTITGICSGTSPYKMFLIDENGNVGIGVENANAKLEVNTPTLVGG